MFFLKRKIIQAVNYLPFYSDIIGTPRHCLNLDTYLAAHPEIVIYDLKSAENVELSKPFLNKTELLHHFTCSRKTLPQFIFQLHNARIWGANGAVITKDDTSTIGKFYNAIDAIVVK